ncbi:hypothetical protein VHEMI02165 [[Torrubiella] hemipterigena]|uniref:Extracellular serine-rich protein n=1 Tax=[Torrubiella] hemipterigena TaxID=1531966 RepID=A0A0A1T9P0_9HYPO|nr:hypothetical protein VHEMI02165 [[Torrubiella] hemipterigena]
MLFEYSKLQALLICAPVTMAAATIRIDAGLNGLAFTPDSTKANVGDVLEFHFHPISHSVVMGDKNHPCVPAASGGFFSGFMPVSSGEGANVFQVTVNSTDPIFFYCAQTVGSHCQSGMVGVINPASDQDLAAYKNAAKSAAESTHPGTVFGGKVLAAGAGASSSSAAKPSTTAFSGSGGGGAYGSSGSAGNSLQVSAALILSCVMGAASFLTK